jgi:hypothetical protein
MNLKNGRQILRLPTGPWLHAPHRRDHALEPGEQQRGRQVDRLVGLRGVAFRGLACAQDGQERRRQRELHQPGHGQGPVLEVKAALERVRRVLGAVAREMHDRGRPDMVKHLVTTGHLYDPGCGRHQALDYARFRARHRERSSLERPADGNEQRVCLRSTNRLG